MSDKTYEAIHPQSYESILISMIDCNPQLQYYPNTNSPSGGLGTFLLTFQQFVTFLCLTSQCYKGSHVFNPVSAAKRDINLETSPLGTIHNFIILSGISHSLESSVITTHLTNLSTRSTTQPSSLDTFICVQHSGKLISQFCLLSSPHFYLSCSLSVHQIKEQIAQKQGACAGGVLWEGELSAQHNGS